MSLKATISSYTRIIWGLVFASNLALAVPEVVNSNTANNFNVSANNNSNKDFCSFSELVSENLEEKGEWVLRGVYPSQTVEYQPNNCSIVPPNIDFSGTLIACLNEVEEKDWDWVYVNVIFIGDSTATKQKDIFDAFIKGIIHIETTYLPFDIDKVDDVTHELHELYNKHLWKTKFVVFNFGLHDIEQSLLRVKEYSDSLTRFVKYLSRYGASLKIFQATMAGWHYGADGSSTVGYFNKVAYDAIKQANHDAMISGRQYLEIPDYKRDYNNKIHIVDGPWINYPKSNSHIADDGKPSVEVLNTAGRMLWMIVFNTLCPVMLNA